MLDIRTHMKARFLLLLSVLALAPALVRADTIVQSFSFDQSTRKSGSGMPARIQSNWDFDNFSCDLGTLLCVEFSFSVNALTNVYDNNQYSSIPVALAADFSAWAGFTFMGPAAIPQLQSETVKRAAEKALVAPSQWYGITDTIQIQHTWEITDAAGLSCFESPDMFMQAAYFVFGTSWCGGIDIDGSMDLTLKYHYASVPDTGSTLALLGGVLLAAAAMRRLRFASV
jgi:hypothetical protein